MTRETYEKYHNSDYVGKHEKQWYNVYRVLGPAGPEERFPVYGKDEAKRMIAYCWDWEVTDTKGDIVKI